MFFHSLHQFAIPSAAPADLRRLTDADFRDLRRAELSPLEIGRLYGRSPSQVQAAAVGPARARPRGVHSARRRAPQGALLLRRQVRQVPRWLAQSRYNGPPPPQQPPASSCAEPRNYAANPAISPTAPRSSTRATSRSCRSAEARGDRRPRSLVPLAGARGARLGDPPGGNPRSAYNPAVSATARFVAFETAEGNLNFAKRYGQIRVFVADRVTGRTDLGSQAIDFSHDHHSAYNPSLSANGRVIAYETSESARGELDVWVTDLRRGHSVRVPEPAGVASDVYEPALSPDGQFLAFTALARGARGERESHVFLRDLKHGSTVQVSGAGESWEPVVSQGGRAVAYTAGTRVVVSSSGRSVKIAPPDPSMTASEPSLSADGARVAFTARGAGGATSVYVHDVASGQATLVSRASGPGGPPAMGASSHPSISADGARVAFTSDAWNLSPAKCNPARGIFVRDLTTQTTKLVSRGDGENAGLGPTKGSGTASMMRVRLLCAV